MKLHIYSYRYAQEILQHANNVDAWFEIERILTQAPVFIYPGRSRNARLQVVQQLMNTYFDRRFAVDCGWDYHPLATGIVESALSADFRKRFHKITIQAEVQFGNMARWYSDIFKFQAAYSQGLIQCGLCVLPVAAMARMTDSNVAHYERAIRELPAANLSITLPILVAGLEQDHATPIIDVRDCRFGGLQDIIGKGNHENRWRIIHACVTGAAMSTVGPESEIGPMLMDVAAEEDSDTRGEVI